jgi:mono/diheme cytochrome c family protein
MTPARPITPSARRISPSARRIATSVGRITTLAVATVWLATAETASRATADDDGRTAHDYLLSCGGCHKLDASGSARVPSLRGLDRLLATPAGRNYVLRVPGVANAPLSDARLAALLDWVFARFGNRTATHFTAAEVGRARTTPFVDPKAARAALAFD